MSKEQRNDWLLKGEIPTSADVTEKSSLSKDNSDAAPGEGPDENPAPASEAGKSQEPNTKQRQRSNGETRFKDFNDELKRLRAEVAELRKPKTDASADSSTARPEVPASPAKPAPPAKLERPVKPKLEAFATYEQYEVAKDAYDEKLAEFKASEKIAEFRASQAKEAENGRIQQLNQQIEEGWKGQVQKGQQAHDDYNDVVGTLGSVIPRNTPTGAAIDSFVLQSEHGGELAYRLGQDGAAEARRIAQLSPMQAFRELVKIELSLEGKGAASSDKPSSDKAPPRKPSSTPPPPADLGARNSAPADEALKAVSDDDFRRFKDIEDRKVLARK